MINTLQHSYHGEFKIIVRPIFLMLICVFISIFFQFSVDYENYVRDWYDAENMPRKDMMSGLYFYILKYANLPINTFGILFYSIMLYLMRKKSLNMQLLVLSSYSVIFSSLIVIRVFAAEILFLFAILLMLNSAKRLYKRVVASMVLVVMSISFHLSLVVLLPIYILLIGSFLEKKNRNIFIFLFFILLSFLIYSTDFYLKIFQMVSFRFEYIGIDQKQISLAQIIHITLLFFEIFLIGKYIKKIQINLANSVLIFGLLLFFSSLIIYDLMVSRVLHIYHLFALLLIVSISKNEPFYLRLYLYLQSFLGLSVLYTSSFFKGIFIEYISAVSLAFLALWLYSFKREVVFYLRKYKNE